MQQVLKSSGKTRSELPTLYAMLFGASAGVTLWLGAYPFDIVKSRMVSTPSGHSLFSHSQQLTLSLARFSFYPSILSANRRAEPR